MSYIKIYRKISLLLAIIFVCNLGYSQIPNISSTLSYITINQIKETNHQDANPINESIINYNTIIFILIFTVILSSIFILFLVRLKQKHKEELSFQKFNLERQQNEFNNQKAEWEIQKGLVIHQRDKIITMLTDLGESIDYARKIQQAIIPSDNFLNKILNDYFLIFQPRESVGGDFYWATKYDNFICFAVADCTGHGVPGGFMSMLGTTMLNEVLIRSIDLKPSSLLDQLRGKMIKALNQTGKDEDSQDGMDICLCVYNRETKEFSYAGANLPIFIYTTTKPEPNDRIVFHDNIIELKPDRMPISFYQKMNNFSDVKITINENDIVYLFSDGYVDQFGGEYNKKFGYNSFRNLISSVINYPIDKQREKIWSALDHWKGIENQTDDILVFGIKI